MATSKQIREFSPTDLCTQLLNTLRSELQEHGALLNFLGEQQRFILERKAEKLMRMTQKIEDQASVCERLRCEREELLKNIQPPAEGEQMLSVRGAAAAFPGNMQPLLTSLTEEIEQLINRTRQRLRQNQELLQRMRSVTENLIQMINPEAPQTYAARGKKVASPEAGVNVCVSA
jgi:flagellar biosynthesis/type III secretory pathway chaperone